MNAVQLQEWLLADHKRCFSLIIQTNARDVYQLIQDNYPGEMTQVAMGVERSQQQMDTMQNFLEQKAKAFGNEAAYTEWLLKAIPIDQEKAAAWLNQYLTK